MVDIRNNAYSFGKTLMTGKKAVRGFTLVESVVSGAMVVLLSGIMLTIMQMNNRGVSSGAVNARIQTQYEIVIDEIGFNARRAAAVLDNSETWAAYTTVTNGFTTRQTNSIKMCNAAGAPIKYFAVNGTALQESTDGTNWTNFKVAGDSVQALPMTAGNVFFELPADRKQVTVLLRVFSSMNNVKDTTAVRNDRFYCRG